MYHNELIKAIEHVYYYQGRQVNQQEKLEFFQQVQKSYGRTALMLSGGAGFGKFHYGVIKALYEADLMPKIICGSSVGSLIAAGLSVLSHDELELATKYESAIRDDIVRWKADSPFETFMQMLKKD